VVSLRLKSAIQPVRSMPHPARRHDLTSDRRRTLRLLAGAPEGCTEAVMLAHGFTVPLLVDLCIAGLAIATPERMVAGGRTAEIVRMKITEAGRAGGPWPARLNSLFASINDGMRAFTCTSMLWTTSVTGSIRY